MKRFFEFIKHTGKPVIVLLVSTFLVFTMAIGTTIALIMEKTDTTQNTFDPPIVRITLEGYDEIKNTGNIPLYVRSIAIVNWVSKDDENNILAETPKVGVDLEIGLVSDIKDDWFLASDGFYYYRKPLNPEETVYLITYAKQITEKVGYELRLMLLSGSIQVYPVNAVNEAWPAVQVNANGELEKAPVTVAESESDELEEATITVTEP